jgi:hypothetical protein
MFGMVLLFRKKWGKKNTKKAARLRPRAGGVRCYEGGSCGVGVAQ